MIAVACEVEWLKARRSRVVAIATLVLLLVPAVVAAGFVAAAARGGSDPTSLKAQVLIPQGGWPGLLGAFEQLYATGGLLGSGIVAVWCVGREFADGTVVSLYATAVGRHLVVAAKLVLGALWSLVLGGAVVLVLVGVGMSGLVPGIAAGQAPPAGALGQAAVLVVATNLLGLTAAAFAAAWRGYLPGFAGLLGLVVVTQVSVVAGVGAWWPYAVPGLWVAGLGVPAAGLLLVPAAVLLVGAGTVWWSRRMLLA